jgi:Na+:H+ antiporter, NhaA family
MVKRARRRLRSAFHALIQAQTSSGLILMAAAALALAVANSALGGAYNTALHAKLGPLDLRHWINDGLMALFFLFVGLEIKREVLDGQLSSWKSRLLPGLAALGGIAAPAAIYLGVTWGDGEAMRGWAIPAATDIAFALGVLALVGRRAPPSLKVFLTALAILDDLAAVAIIAIFYTENLHLPALAGAAASLAALIAMNRLKFERLAPYLVVGAALWAFTYASGVHATLAGVALALTIPLRRSHGRRETAGSPLHRLEHGLSPWIAFVIVPVFGFANAGVSFAGLTAAQATAAIPAGVALGLFVGKPFGVLAAVWLARRLGAQLPSGATWMHMCGVAALCGVGFTMSLFIGALAFHSEALSDLAKLGTLAGSFASALLGYALLRAAPRPLAKAAPAAQYAAVRH